MTIEEVFSDLYDKYGEDFNWYMLPLTQADGMFVTELKNGLCVLIPPSSIKTDGNLRLFRFYAVDGQLLAAHSVAYVNNIRKYGYGRKNQKSGKCQQKDSV